MKQWPYRLRWINRFGHCIPWSRIPPARFSETKLAFGRWQAQDLGQIFYAIDNEVHHREQGYVYLRALGIEPPAFWERSAPGVNTMLPRSLSE